MKPTLYGSGHLGLTPRQWNIVAVFASAFAFYLNSACVSFAAQHTRVTAGYFVIARALVGAIMTPLVILLVSKNFSRPTRITSLCMRAIAYFFASITFFEATARLGPSLGNLLNMTYPIFLAIFAIFDPAERCGVRSTIISTMVAFVGMVLVLNPTSGSESDLSGIAIGLLSGMIGALAVASLKRARASNSPETILLFLFGISLPLSLIFYWQELIRPTNQEFLLLFFGSLAGVVGQYLFALGARHITAAESGVISQSRIVIAAMIGQMLALEAALGISQIIGISMICLINIHLLLKKTAGPATTTIN